MYKCVQPQIKPEYNNKTTHIATHTHKLVRHACIVLLKYFLQFTKCSPHTIVDCSFVVLHFVNIYFSVSFICVLLCSERKITQTDK